MPRRELDAALASAATQVSLPGSRAADRYDDDELARLGVLAIEELSLSRHPISRLPPLQPTLRRLTLANLALESLDGIEDQIRLQALSLTDLPALDLEAAFGQLAELPELTTLRLGGASLRVLPRAITKLPSVVEVELVDCAQLELADAFAKLGAMPTLRILRIEGVVVIPDKCAALASLRVLDLRGCKLKALPPSIGRLGSLEELDISNNPIRILPGELCALAKLRILRAADVALRTLPAQIGRLANLELLCVTGDKMATLPASIGDLAKLRTLELSDHIDVPESLYRLSLESFEGPSDAVRRLVLRAPPTPDSDSVEIDDAERMPADFGDPLELVIKLPDHDAPIVQLSALRRLRSLAIEVKELGDVLARVAHCQYLRCASVVAPSNGSDNAGLLPDAIGELVELTSLCVDGYGVPDALGRLTNLETLEIGRHSMTRLPDAIGRLANLTELSLHPHGIVELPGALGELGKLRTLRLAHAGRLDRLPAELARCRALETIEIGGAYQDCKLFDVDVLGGLPALKRFAINRNRAVPIVQILRALAGTQLEELDIGDNPIVVLPSEIGGLARLRRLHLPPHLTSLPAELRACRELRYVANPPRDLQVKDYLPAGRWRKSQRGGDTWFERTDP
ncbi:MAG: leucine-rich repeat domain-containing protein [Myxococcota bacterium]|nr:leucine-rich repeat domain-containing protein [Myxococcota bacterium]